MSFNSILREQLAAHFPEEPDEKLAQFATALRGAMHRADYRLVRIPKGKAVQHLNGRPDDNQLDNLILVDIEPSR